ncbi:hypothetical protein XENOCAPTIV_006793 [Xenoophorus captivus]|uniref:Uncharacterized protein n=1 Tax=Xenoophorus captivus TaxID=1517983 RepID=A0ABV0QR93_9TELE
MLTSYAAPSNFLEGQVAFSHTRLSNNSVARVQPRTSKGITDLLLLNLVWLNATCPSKKLDANRTGPRN